MSEELEKYLTTPGPTLVLFEDRHFRLSLDGRTCIFTLLQGGRMKGKATTTIVKNHGVVVIEDLKVKAMTKTGRGTLNSPGTLVQKRANENRALLEVSPRAIRTMLEYKSAWYGSKLIVVDPAETSQRCSACQAVDAASRISRSRFVCANCGSFFDADVNAAKNILALGINPTGGHPEMACESSRVSGRKQEEDARESGSSVLQGRE